MGRKIFIHVGMDKTGTSAIQQFIFKNRKTFLKDSGIYYPKTGMWSDYSHHPYAFSIVQQYGYSNGDMPSLLKKLSREVRPYDYVLLSSECLFKTPRNKNFAGFWGFVTSVFEEVVIIVYVRRQDLWVESRHKHSILSGAELEIEKLCGDWFCNYKQFIDSWAELVGQDSVVVRAYEREQFHGGSIYGDFLDLFGIEMDEKYICPSDIVNTSLGGEEALFKKLCNQIGLEGRGAAEVNAVLLERSKAEKEIRKCHQMMTAEQREQLIAKYSEVNSSIAKEYIAEKDGVLFENTSVARDNGDEVCLRLSNHQVEEIARYIKNTSPKAMRIIKRQIEKVIKNPKSEEAGVAATKLINNF
jgi:hypothetical protein